MKKGFGKVVLNPQQQREVKILKQSVLKHFQEIPDPRMERTRHHSLGAILTIAILAVLSGADGFVAIEVYGKTKQSWLEQFLDLPYGIPSHDTFGRAIGAIEPMALQESFLAWIATIAAKLKIEVIHIDGKTARGSYDREGKLKALHMVSAWSSEHGLVLAQQKIEGKSNEITALPQLLKLLNLKGAVVTLDAMGTQTGIARQIKRQEGNYALALKGNQEKLYKQVEAWFWEASTNYWQGIEYSYHKTVESGHHRIETRQVWVVSVNQLPGLHRQSQWEGLTTVVMVRRWRQLWNKTTTEIQFYLSSLEADAEGHSWVIRSHWSIENSLHWVLDVTFNEDASRIRQGNAAQNLGFLRQLSISLLKQEPSKLSLKMKRYTAGMDNDFLLQVLNAGIA